MADVFMYADETGNLDYNGGSTYLGIGSATWGSEPAELSRPGFVGGYDALASGMIIE